MNSPTSYPQRLLIATHNRGKQQEFRNALQREFPELQILTPDDIDPKLEPPKETGTTYHENAQTKARHGYKRSGGIPTMADDSGIEVEALPDQLGVDTHPWGKGECANDEEWIAYFLKRMQDATSRRAAFICCIVYIDGDGKEHVFEGRCEGTITHAVEAGYPPGLPLSGCFKPDGQERVFSALPPEERLAVSHRGKALKAFIKHLQATLGTSTTPAQEE